MYDAAVIGAGVIGAMTARELTRRKLKVCMLEKGSDVAFGASRANSGIVHAGFDAKPGTLKAKFNVLGAEKMEKVAKELGVKYRKNGSMVIGFNDADRAVIEELYERGRTNGVKELEIVEGKALKSLETGLSDRVICALYAPTGGIICPYELTVAAAGNAMDNGAELKTDFEVTKITRRENIFVISSPNGEIEARFVVNAAGLYADKIASMVGDNSFSVRPRRGEYLLLDKECGKIVPHTIFRTPTAMGKGILISPTVDGNLLLGPTSEEIGDKDDRSVSAKGIERILKEAAENVKGIPFRQVITSFTGLRSVGSSGDFIITSPLKGFVNAAGIESPGLSASPAIAEHIAAMLESQGLTAEKNEAFQPIRKSAHAFREADMEEKNAVIRDNPAFGRVVCRCETVTEGEILEAIHTNPPARTLDAVKRRTRAQMGRCQGGFCMPIVAELLARELNIPYEDVTKSGGASYINVGKTKEAK